MVGVEGRDRMGKGEGRAISEREMWQEKERRKGVRIAAGEGEDGSEKGQRGREEGDKDSCEETPTFVEMRGTWNGRERGC